MARRKLFRRKKKLGKLGKGAIVPTKEQKREKARAERYRRRRINLLKKAVDLYEMFETRFYIAIADEKKVYVLNSDPTMSDWPPAPLNSEWESVARVGKRGGSEKAWYECESVVRV